MRNQAVESISINSFSYNSINLTEKYPHGSAILTKSVANDFIEIVLPLNFFLEDLQNFRNSVCSNTSDWQWYFFAGVFFPHQFMKNIKK